MRQDRYRQTRIRLFFPVPVPVRNPDICADMFVDRSFDDAGYVIDIPFCGKKRMRPHFENDSDMVVLHVLENPVVDDDVARFGNKILRPFVIFYPPIIDGELLPAEASRQMAGLAFGGSVRDLKSRFRAAKEYKRRAP